MRLKAAIKGDLDKFLKEEIKNGKKASTQAVRTAANRLKLKQRQKLANNRMSRRLQNTWRADVYPQGGKTSFRAAANVYTKAPHIMEGLEKGSLIKSSNGMFLAIPTPQAPKLGKDRKKISPSNFPEHKFGRLRFVYRRGGPSLLVVDNAAVSYSQKRGSFGRVRTASKRARSTSKGLSTVVMFILVPQVRMPKILNFEQDAGLAQNSIPNLILRKWKDNIK